MKVMTVVTGLWNVLLLGTVYGGIQHYTGHHCIAAAGLAALFYVVGRLKSERFND